MYVSFSQMHVSFDTSSYPPYTLPKAHTFGSDVCVCVYMEYRMSWFFWEAPDFFVFFFLRAPEEGKGADAPWQIALTFTKRDIFCKRATNYRALLHKVICKDRASYGSSTPCTEPRGQVSLRVLQCAAVRCRKCDALLVLRCVAMRCSVLPSVLQIVCCSGCWTPPTSCTTSVAVCCNALQCVAGRVLQTVCCR